jgi:hypothetical protein
MAKHPHRLLLMDKKTWKCTLDGCSFFVHLGLAHILIGKSAVCWGCGDTFTLNEYALKEDQPRCDECRLGNSLDIDQISANIARKIKSGELSVTQAEELDTDKDNPVSEVIHDPLCEIWKGGDCDCF